MTSAPVDLATVPDELERLAATLLGSGQRVPEISAACDALACAAVLLRTQRHLTAGDAGHADLLHESLGLARSVVETTKYACRARTGARREAGRRL
jgi:hypothetical protein